MITFVLVFLAYFCMDALFIFYLKYVKENRPCLSGIAAALMYVLMAYGVVSFTKDLIFIVPIACGSFLGTSLVVWWQHRKETDAVSDTNSRTT